MLIWEGKLGKGEGGKEGREKKKQIEHTLKSSIMILFLFGKVCFGYSRSFVLQYEIQNCFSSSMKNAIDILMNNALSLWIVLGSKAILTILILPVHEHRKSLLHSVSYSFSFTLFYSFYSVGFLGFHLMVRFIPFLYMISIMRFFY